MKKKMSEKRKYTKTYRMMVSLIF